MSEKLGFCLILVCIQGSIENQLEVGRGSGGGGSDRVSLRHGSCGEGEKRQVGEGAPRPISLVTDTGFENG